MVKSACIRVWLLSIWLATLFGVPAAGVSDAPVDIEGTWQYDNLEVAGYTETEAKAISSVRMEFRFDGSVTRTVKYVSGETQQVNGCFTQARDTLHILWECPEEYNGGTFTIARDDKLLTFKLCNSAGEAVRLHAVTAAATTRIEDLPNRILGAWQVTRMDWKKHARWSRDSTEYVRFEFMCDGIMTRIEKPNDDIEKERGGTYTVSWDTLDIQWVPGFSCKSECVLTGRELLLVFGSPPWDTIALERTNARRYGGGQRVVLVPDVPPQHDVPEELTIPAPIPSSLVDMVLRKDTSQQWITQVVMKAHGTLFLTARENAYDTPYLDVTQRDLDGDGVKEIVLLIGWDANNTRLTILKKEGHSWSAAMSEPVCAFNYDPSVEYTSTSSGRTLLRVLQLQDRGSGVWRYSYQFFKLIDGRGYLCLELPQIAHLYGWGMPLNEDVELADCRIDSLDDAIHAVYTYRFYPGTLDESDSSDDGPDPSYEGISFVDGKDEVVFRWDDSSRTYQPQFSGRPDGLNSEKLARFGQFGDDSGFVTAFDGEIEGLLGQGPSETRSCLERYLEIVYRAGNTNFPPEDQEMKAKIGRTGFYGPKKDR